MTVVFFLWRGWILYIYIYTDLLLSDGSTNSIVAFFCLMIYFQDHLRLFDTLNLSSTF